MKYKNILKFKGNKRILDKLEILEIQARRGIFLLGQELTNNPRFLKIMKYKNIFKFKGSKGIVDKLETNSSSTWNFSSWRRINE